MHDEVLESDGYPEIIYECSKLSASKTGEGQYWVALNGELSMHGVTRSQPISARVTVNGDTLRRREIFPCDRVTMKSSRSRQQEAR